MRTHWWQLAILVVIGLYYCAILMEVVRYTRAVTHDMSTLPVQEKPKLLDPNVLAQRDVTLAELATIFLRLLFVVII